MQWLKRKITPEPYEKKFASLVFWIRVFSLNYLGKSLLAVFDFVAPSGSRCYVSCLMSTWPEFKTHSVPRSCCWMEQGEGKGQGYELETGLKQRLHLKYSLWPWASDWTSVSFYPQGLGWQNERVHAKLSYKPNTLAVAFTGSDHQRWQNGHGRTSWLGSALTSNLWPNHKPSEIFLLTGIAQS